MVSIKGLQSYRIAATVLLLTQVIAVKIVAKDFQDSMILPPGRVCSCLQTHRYAFEQVEECVDNAEGTHDRSDRFHHNDGLNRE